MTFHNGQLVQWVVVADKDGTVNTMMARSCQNAHERLPKAVWCVVSSRFFEHQHQSELIARLPQSICPEQHDRHSRSILNQSMVRFSPRFANGNTCMIKRLAPCDDSWPWPYGLWKLDGWFHPKSCEIARTLYESSERRHFMTISECLDWLQKMTLLHLQPFFSQQHPKPWNDQTRGIKSNQVRVSSQVRGTRSIGTPGSRHAFLIGINLFPVPHGYESKLLGWKILIYPSFPKKC